MSRKQAAIVSFLVLFIACVGVTVFLAPSLFQEDGERAGFALVVFGILSIVLDHLSSGRLKRLRESSTGQQVLTSQYGDDQQLWPSDLLTTKKDYFTLFLMNFVGAGFCLYSLLLPVDNEFIISGR